jgi:hypothetical protein
VTLIILPPSPLAHVRGRCLGAKKRAFQVDIHHGVPLLFRHLEHHGGTGKTGIVYKNVNPAEGIDRSLHDCFRVHFPGHISLESLSMSPQLFNLLNHVMSRFLIGGVVDHDLRPFPSIRDGDQIFRPPGCFRSPKRFCPEVS